MPFKYVGHLEYTNAFRSSIRTARRPSEYEIAWQL